MNAYEWRERLAQHRQGTHVVRPAGPAAADTRRSCQTSARATYERAIVTRVPFKRDGERGFIVHASAVTGDPDRPGFVRLMRGPAGWTVSVFRRSNFLNQWDSFEGLSLRAARVACAVWVQQQMGSEDRDSLWRLREYLKSDTVPPAWGERSTARRRETLTIESRLAKTLQHITDDRRRPDSRYVGDSPPVWVRLEGREPERLTGDALARWQRLSSDKTRDALIDLAQRTDRTLTDVLTAPPEQHAPEVKRARRFAGKPSKVSPVDGLIAVTDDSLIASRGGTVALIVPRDSDSEIAPGLYFGDTMTALDNPGLFGALRDKLGNADDRARTLRGPCTAHAHLDSKCLRAAMKSALPYTERASRQAVTATTIASDTDGSVHVRTTHPERGAYESPVLESTTTDTFAALIDPALVLKALTALTPGPLTMGIHPNGITLEDSTGALAVIMALCPPKK